jgi:hypothetical protein
MTLLPLAVEHWNNAFYLHLPVLIVAISLVYSATRFEEWPHIWREALRWALRMVAFLVLVVIVLYVVARWV